MSGYVCGCRVSVCWSLCFGVCLSVVYVLGCLSVCLCVCSSATFQLFLWFGWQFPLDTKNSKNGHIYVSKVSKVMHR